jgi:hypothetical protein
MCFQMIEVKKSFIEIEFKFAPHQNYLHKEVVYQKK